MYGGKIGDGIGFLVWAAGISLALLIIGGAYSVCDYYFIDDVYEVAAPIQPEIKLKTDGEKIDTVYVYRFE